MYSLICTTCGNTFQSRFPAVKLCSDCKNRPCEVCGRPFVHKWPYDQRTCSKACRKVLLNDPMNVAQKEVKRRKTVQEKYGVDNVSKLTEVKDKISLVRKDLEFYNEMKAELAVKSKSEKKLLIRKCVICGEDFEARGSQTTCNGPHYRYCVICGSQFEYKHISDKKLTCSSECKAKLRKQNIVSEKRICAYCRKPFYSTSNTAKYCEGPHYKKCEICGNEFEVNLQSGCKIENLPKTCSMECKEKLRAQYYKNNPEAKIQAVEKGKQTCMNKYGVPFASMTEEARSAAREKTYQTMEQRKQTNLERYGFQWFAQSPEGKDIMSRTKLKF